MNNATIYKPEPATVLPNKGGFSHAQVALSAAATSFPAAKTATLLPTLVPSYPSNVLSSPASTSVPQLPFVQVGTLNVPLAHTGGTSNMLALLMKAMAPDKPPVYSLAANTLVANTLASPTANLSYLGNIGVPATVSTATTTGVCAVKSRAVKHAKKASVSPLMLPKTLAAAELVNPIAATVQQQKRPRGRPKSDSSARVCPFPGCARTFRSSFSLRRHLKRHTGERPWACKETGCGKAFAEKSTLALHMRIHRGEKPFKCKHEHCGRSFADRTNYRRHLLVHTGEKPHVCPIPRCLSRYTRKSQLAEHLCVTHCVTSM